MKVLCDSSVLISAFVESHPSHKSSFALLEKAKENEFTLIVSSHSILEVFSVLTGAPFRPKITPEIAVRIIENNVKNLAKIYYLTGKEYLRLINKMGEYNFSGGIVYDQLIVECAVKAKADEIITLNLQDFIKLTPGLNIEVSSPQKFLAK